MRQYESTLLCYKQVCVLLSLVHVSSCHLVFVCSLVRPFPLHHLPALVIHDSEQKHLFPHVAPSFSSPSSHLFLSLLSSSSPLPSLAPLFVPLSVQPRVAIETHLFEIGGKENYFSLLSTLPPFRSLLCVSSDAAFIQFRLNES